MNGSASQFSYRNNINLIESELQFRTQIRKQIPVANQSELEALLKKGLQYQQDGNPGEAIKCYDQVLQNIPHQIDAAYFKSILLLNSKHLDEVIALLSPIADPDRPPPLSFTPQWHDVIGS